MFNSLSGNDSDVASPFKTNIRVNKNFESHPNNLTLINMHKNKYTNNATLCRVYLLSYKLINEKKFDSF